MKVHTMIAAAALLMSVAAGAQEEKRQMRSEKMVSALNLSDDQAAKWKAAESAHLAANKPLHEKLKGSTTPEERAQLRKSIRENHVAFRKDVYGFLNSAQVARFEELQKKHRGHGKRHKRDTTKGHH